MGIKATYRTEENLAVNAECAARRNHLRHLLELVCQSIFGRKGRLVEQHDARVHAQRAGDRHALLLAAGELARIFVRLLGDLHPLQEVHGDLLGLLLRHLAHPDRRERAVFEDRQVREEVEVLEHHADLAAHLVDLLQVVGELDAVDDDLALLVLLQPVDAADHRRLARARTARR